MAVFHASPKAGEGRVFYLILQDRKPCPRQFSFISYRFSWRLQRPNGIRKINIFTGDFNGQMEQHRNVRLKVNYDVAKNDQQIASLDVPPIFTSHDSYQTNLLLNHIARDFIGHQTKWPTNLPYVQKKSEPVCDLYAAFGISVT